MTMTNTLQLDEKCDLYRILALPDPVPPKKMTPEEYGTLSREQRRAFDEQRLDWLATDLRFNTPSRVLVNNAMRFAKNRNRGRVSGRWGVLVSGSSGMGKTTSAIALMRTEFARFVSANPDWERESRIPIVYVEVPAGASGKAMLGRFLHFLGYDSYDSWTLEKRTRVVVDTLKRARTELVIVDEFHNLVARSAGHQETANVLKGLSNIVSATFLYSGINIHRSRVTAGETGQQITTRFRPVEIGRFTLTTKEDRDNWKSLIAAFELQLCLLNHTPGSLPKLHDYLYRRTNGVIGSLANLILGGAQELILRRDPGDETLTQDYLSTIALDLEAQRHEDGDPLAA